jgi:GT2 family glycosyltransferase
MNVTAPARRVSVIVVSWNGRHHLETCLPALLSQYRQPNELIVVDNGSVDGTNELVVSHFPDVILVGLDENRGFTGGNIAGFAASSGEYIVLLNNDTRPEPDWLEQLILCADAHPEVGIVASHMTDWEGCFTDSAGDAVNVLGRAHQLRKGRPASDQPEGGYVFSACAGAALYKRAMIEDVGFLDDSFFMNVEDSDLAFRAQLRGWKTYMCPAAIVRHRVSASQGAGSKANAFFNSRNYVWSYVKNMPTPLVLKYGWLLAADLVLKAAISLSQGNLGSYLRGLIAGFGGARAKLAERRRIQATRAIPLRTLEESLTYPRLIRRLVGER